MCLSTDLAFILAESFIYAYFCSDGCLLPIEKSHLVFLCIQCYALVILNLANNNSYKLNYSS